MELNLLIECVHNNLIPVGSVHEKNKQNIKTLQNPDIFFNGAKS